MHTPSSEKANVLTVWVLQTGEPIPFDAGSPRAMRAINTVNVLNDAGHKVILWSSVFNHQSKTHRKRQNFIEKNSDLLEIRLIDSPGYSRNIGLARLIDHWILGRNLRRMFKDEQSRPDVAFLGYPPIETSYEMGRWLKRQHIPYLLDVKDLWPQVFLEVFPKRLQALGRFLLSTYFRKAEWTIENASAISSMADTFLNKVVSLGKRGRTTWDKVFYLTSQSDFVSTDDIKKAKDHLYLFGLSDEQKFRICYIGNLSDNVNFIEVIECAKYFLNNGNKVEFVICGDGVSRQKFIELSKGLDNIIFPGRINRAEILALAEISQAALIPYINNENFIMSLPNKSIDYLALGLPILSPLEGEVCKLIKDEGVGISYGPSFNNSLTESVQELMENPDLREGMSMAAKSAYNNKYSYDLVYGGLVKHLVKLANSSER